MIFPLRTGMMIKQIRELSGLGLNNKELFKYYKEIIDCCCCCRSVKRSQWDLSTLASTIFRQNKWPAWNFIPTEWLLLTVSNDVNIHHYLIPHHLHMTLIRLDSMFHKLWSDRDLVGHQNVLMECQSVWIGGQPNIQRAPLAPGGVSVFTCRLVSHTWCPWGSVWGRWTSGWAAALAPGPSAPACVRCSAWGRSGPGPTWRGDRAASPELPPCPPEAGGSLMGRTYRSLHQREMVVINTTWNRY